jgi:hypothetical protein
VTAILTVIAFFTSRTENGFSAHRTAAALVATGAELLAHDTMNGA